MLFNMKKLIFLLLIIPTIASAAWWNPLTWFQKVNEPLIENESIIQLGAPSSNIFRDITPDTDSLRYLGTTTPVTRWFGSHILYASSTAISLSDGSATTTITSATSTFANGISLTSGCITNPSGSCIGGLSGSGVANQVAFWSTASQLGGDTGLTYNSTSDTLTATNLTVDDLVINQLVEGDLVVSGDGYFNGNQINLGTGDATTTVSGGFSGFGIATTTPGGALSVASSGTSTALLVSNTGTNYTAYFEDVSADTSPFVIDSGGNVGIGTTAPDSLLNISANTTATVAPMATTYLHITGADSANNPRILLD